MKKVIVFIVFSVLIFSRVSAFGEINVNQEQSQNQKQKQETESSAEANVITEERIQGVQPQLPQHLWQGPLSTDEYFSWQKYGRSGKQLEKEEWTRSRVNNIVNNTGVLGAAWGWPFRVKSRSSWCPRTDRVELRFNLSLDDDALKDYKRLEVIRVYAKKDNLDQDEVLAFAIRLAMNNGANLVVLKEENHGLNTLMKGDSLGLPFSFTGVRGNNVYAGGVGWGSAEIGRTWKPGVILVPFIKNSKVETAVEVIEKEQARPKSKKGFISAKRMGYIMSFIVKNSNGSTSKVSFEVVENGYIGPRGEFYAKVPTCEQLSVYDLCSDENREKARKFTYAFSE